jgi:hypothetical protein
MTNDFRLLVTGSRDWDRPDIIQEVFRWVEATKPGKHYILIHGMCDPRHPRDHVAVPWVRAQHLRPDLRLQLDGADWHADVIATELRWEIERRPADWQRHRKAAGFRRNADMVNAGADLCAAFLGPCIKPGCREPQPHASHGGSHCAGLAEKAGIETRRFMAPSLTVTAALQEETR